MDNRDLQSDVLIPALQSIISGLILGIAAWALAALAGQERSWAWGVAAWAIVTAAAWLVLLRRAWWIVERVLGVDINRDGYIGAPVVIDSQPQPIRIDLIENGEGAYPSGQFLDLPIDRQRMIMLALELQSGASLGHNLAGPGKPITRSEYERLRDYLIMAGLARWRSEYSHKEGVTLSARGRATIKAFALMGTTPTLIDHGRSGDLRLLPGTRSTQSLHRERFRED